MKEDKRGALTRAPLMASLRGLCLRRVSGANTIFCHLLLSVAFLPLPAQARSRRRPQLLPAHTRPRVGSGTRGHLHCVPFGPAVSNPRECSRSARRSDPTPGPKDKVQMRWALGIIIKRQRTDLTPAARPGLMPVNQNTRRARSRHPPKLANT
jgi:hypothetical protein